jgi:hypothetical protein
MVRASSCAAATLMVLAALALALALSGCGPQKTESTAVKPAKLEVIGHEAELLKLTLTPDAERRLGLTSVVIGQGSMGQKLTVHGEIVAPGAGGLPANASVDTAGLAANQARADADVARAKAQLDLALATEKRADDLVKADAGSLRARDEALSAVAVARANLKSAQTQRALLGPDIMALQKQGFLWAKATLSSGDLGRVDRAASANVQALGEGVTSLSASPVTAPPSANAVAGTVDLFYGFSNTGNAITVGQRVAVDLPLKAASTGLTVPTSAILRDIYGGEWVYVRAGPHAYERRRIEVSAIKGEAALLARGLKAGDEVITAGAAELFGTEFGAK